MKNFNKTWIIQRISGLILIPLTFWFITNFISFLSMQYFEILIFFNSGLNSFLFLLMMIIMSIHAKFGFDNIIEDYVRERNKKNISKIIITILVSLSIIVSVFAIMKVSIV